MGVRASSWIGLGTGLIVWRGERGMVYKAEGDAHRSGLVGHDVRRLDVRTRYAHGCNEKKGHRILMSMNDVKQEEDCE